jgi:hypothetical protein
MSAAVLNELRHLSSARFDSHMLLTTILAGDLRLVEKSRSVELLPLASRMRVKLSPSTARRRTSSRSACTTAWRRRGLPR